MDLMTKEYTSEEAAKREEFLAAMSHVANSVTVVTTDGPGGIHGATVSSFCSVSADPPTLLVCLNEMGRTAEAVIKNKVFCVNVLPEESSKLAVVFAGHTGLKELDRFSDPAWHKDGVTPPILKNVTAFQCEVTETVKATSHYVFIGKVTSISNGEHPPLIYLNRKFCRTVQLEDQS